MVVGPAVTSLAATTEAATIVIGIGAAAGVILVGGLGLYVIYKLTLRNQS